MKLGKMISNVAIAAVLTTALGWMPVMASADGGAPGPQKHWKGHRAFRKGECVGFNLATVQKVSSLKEATPEQKKAAREACFKKHGSGTSG